MPRRPLAIRSISPTLRGLGVRTLWLCGALGQACAPAASPRGNPPPPESAAAPTLKSLSATPEPEPRETLERTRPAGAGGAAAQADAGTPLKEPAPALPAGITPGEVVRLSVPGDKPVLVAHAPASVQRVALYLHGVCGDIDAIRSWAKGASKHLTLIALYADESCGSGGRYRWNGNTSAQEQRIERALARVQEARGGLLQTDERVLIGYSQGALRALALRSKFPDRYPRMLLGGLPTETPAARVAGVQRLALIAGEREAKSHIEASQQHFQQAGVASQLFVLPGAGHGEYGPNALEIMSSAFEWLMQ